MCPNRIDMKNPITIHREKYYESDLRAQSIKII